MGAGVLLPEWKHGTLIRQHVFLEAITCFFKAGEEVVADSIGRAAGFGSNRGPAAGVEFGHFVGALSFQVKPEVS